MKKIIPEKLKIGDEIRIIAPSRSLKILKEDVIEINAIYQYLCNLEFIIVKYIKILYVNHF